MRVLEKHPLFIHFSLNITNLIGRYASEDYTDNHMKILAVTLMEEPPIELFEELRNIKPMLLLWVKRTRENKESSVCSAMVVTLI